MAAFLFGLLAVIPGAAAQGPPAQGVYVGVHGGGHFVLDTWDLGAPAALARVGRLNTGGALTLKLGYQPASWVGFELENELIFAKPDIGGVQTADRLSLSAWVELHRDIVSPYLLVGGGYFLVYAGQVASDADWETHLGVGARWFALPWLAVRLEGIAYLTNGTRAASHLLSLTAGVDFYVWTQSADRDGDGIVDGADRCPDTPGVRGAGGCPDRDGDGLTDQDDRCPDVAGPRDTDGCPDRDRDGVFDDTDRCPDAPGTVALRGCPDSDSDGLSDADDACPKEAGTPLLRGCPDRDGDGVSDAEDTCPDAAGPRATAGCPDADGDQVPDASDRCPQSAGPKALKGCPDRDNDGIEDVNDKCPQKFGVPEEQGCPPKELQSFEGAIEGINFALGSADLTPDSLPILQKAAGVLKKFPALRLAIEGHTDSQGDPEENLALSRARAGAVRTYLVEQGIDGARLEATGFGASKPVATNDTRTGRRKNRRIEFRILSM